jgi:hypothetical protein
MANKIRLLRREEIEPSKWNGCIYYALNSRMYGYTWFLDNICDEWFGLVEEEYESVLPIIVRKHKYLLFNEIYQPPLAQQLGLFSMHVCSPTRLAWFFDAMPAEYKRLNMQFNFGNASVQSLSEKGYTVSARPNFVLSLARPYEEITAEYSSNLRRNLKKTAQAELYLSTDLSPEKFIAEVKKHHLLIGNSIGEYTYNACLRIIYNCQHRGQGVIFSAFNQEREFQAGVFMMFDGMRLVNLINVSSEAGRKNNAMAYLLDAIIQTHAGQLKVMDFEGSAIEGIARFYESFGASNEPYYQVSKNTLSWWQKILLRS